MENQFFLLVKGLNKMSGTKFLAFDTETGGLGDDVSLLTVNFAVCDEHWNVIEELDMIVKPDNNQYVVTAEALEINKIDLINHDKLAITYSQAGQSLRNFLHKNYNDGKIKLIPFGKNINFDISKVTDNLLGAKTWNQYVSYRQYDLTGLIMYLKRKGSLAKDAPESLEGLAKYFNIHETWHSARGDNMAGIKLIKLLESL